MERLRPQELIELCIYWRYYTQCHCPLLEAVSSLAEYHPHKTVQCILWKIEAALIQGNTLSKALQLFPKVFDRVFVQLMQVAEQLGDYGYYLEKAEAYLRWQLQVRQMIYEALRYPLILLILLVILFVLVDYLLVPQFDQLFKTLGIENYSLMTQTFLSSMYFLPWIFIAGFFLSIFFYYYDRMSLPLIGPIFGAIEFLTFTQQLGILLQSKIDLISALHIASQSTAHPQKYERISHSVSQGIALSVAIQDILPTQSGLGRMIHLGERTGQLGEILQKVSQAELERVHHKVSQWLSLLQPGLVIIMGGILIGIVGGILWPIYQVLPACG